MTKILKITSDELMLLEKHDGVVLKDQVKFIDPHSNIEYYYNIELIREDD